MKAENLIKSEVRYGKQKELPLLQAQYWPYLHSSDLSKAPTQEGLLMFWVFLKHKNIFGHPPTKWK